MCSVCVAVLIAYLSVLIVLIGDRYVLPMKCVFSVNITVVIAYLNASIVMMLDM